MMGVGSGLCLTGTYRQRERVERVSERVCVTCTLSMAVGRRNELMLENMSQYIWT